MLKFTCRNCGETGPAHCGYDVRLLHCPWYKDHRGIVHGCLYCRNCGTVHDTIGSLLGLIKMILGRIPSKVIAVYDVPTFSKLLKINNPNFRTLERLHPSVVSAMSEDGRLPDDEDLANQPSDEFLHHCLENPHPDVRREAQIALERLKGASHTR